MDRDPLEAVKNQLTRKVRSSAWANSYTHIGNTTVSGTSAEWIMERTGFAQKEKYTSYQLLSSFNFLLFFMVGQAVIPFLV